MNRYGSGKLVVEIVCSGLIGHFSGLAGVFVFKKATSVICMSFLLDDNCRFQTSLELPRSLQVY